MASSEVPRSLNSPENSSDDFEIIHEPPSTPDNVEFPTLFSVSPTRPVDGGRQEEEGFDADNAFILIQQQHEAFRNELLQQQSLISTGLETTRKNEESKNREISQLKEQISDSNAELISVKSENEQLRQQLAPMKKYREQVDELTAKLYEAEDWAKHQDTIIRQFHTDGFVSVQPPMLTDQLLAQELTDKESSLREQQNRIEKLEETLLQEREINEKIQSDNNELKGLTAILQDQSKDDQNYIAEVRDQYETQLSVVRDEMERLKMTLSGQPSTTQMMTSSGYPPQLPYPIRPNEPQPQAPTSTEQLFVCPHCNLRICDQRLFQQHTERCPPMQHLQYMD